LTIDDCQFAIINFARRPKLTTRSIGNRKLEIENDLRFDDFAAAQAGGANAHALGGRAHAGMHRAQVDVPAPRG
jgi:hypothetical protein